MIVTWFGPSGVEKSKVKVRVKVMVQQFSVGSNSMSAF